MIAIIDYDAGNIKSVEKALLHLGQEVVVTGDRDAILSADKVILPGVGAFGDAMAMLEKTGLDDVIRKTVERGAVSGHLSRTSASVRAQRGSAGRAGTGHPEGRNPPHPGEAGPEDSPHGLEFPSFGA